MNIEINKCDFLKIYNEKCQNLKELHKSVNHNFPNDQSLHDIKTYPFKVQGEPMDFNVTEHEVHGYGFRLHIATNL